MNDEEGGQWPPSSSPRVRPAASRTERAVPTKRHPESERGSARVAERECSGGAVEPDDDTRRSRGANRAAVGAARTE